MKRVLALAIALVIGSSVTAWSQVLLFYGRVVDTAGAPVAGAEVAVFRDDLLVAVVRTEPDGTFRLQIPRGEYVVRVYKLGYEPIYLSFSAIPERGGDIGTFVLKEGVEVVPEALSFAVRQGDRVPVRVTVRNKGLDPIPIRFAFEAPPGWTFALLTEGGVSTSEIYVQPRSSRNLTLAIAVPYNASPSASARLIAQWAGLSKVYEFKFDVAERRWVVLETPISGLEGYPGALLRVPLTLRNELPSEVTFLLASLAPSGWITSILDRTGVSVSRVTLPPSTSRNLTLLVYIPPTAPAGSYAVTVLADSQILKATRELSVKVESRYDLLNITVPVTRLNVTSGSTATVNIVVKNSGNAPTAALLSVRSSSPHILCRFQTVGAPETSVYLLPGEERTLPVVIEALPSVGVGEYLVTFSASGSTSRTEQGMVVKVAGAKSISVDTSGLYVRAAPGVSGVVNIRVVNTGTVPLNLSLRVLSAPPGFSVDIAPTSAALQPGGSAVLSLAVKPPPNATEGFYNVFFSVEGDGVRELRVVAVEVAGEAGVGYPALAVPLAALSFAIVLYNQRRVRGRGA